MTAIYGLWSFDGRDIALDSKRMDQALRRYGQDDHEVWIPDRDLRLGRHLNCSVPEDGFRAQAGPRSRYVVAGDVRLTEREDLARELGLGAEAARMSDASIAAAALETWHADAFDRLYGAFAIAAWDKRERRLLLARDHLGLKPLFFHRAGSFFAFASMPGGLHALPDIPRGSDVDSIKRFLALENPAAGKTHYQGIARVMPGHYAVITPRSLTETRYWKPDLTPLGLPTSDDYAAALEQHFDRAVGAALRGAEAQVGAHLSCGFDSTAVATTAARQQRARGGTVIAYTAAPREGYPSTTGDRIADESMLAAQTAAMHSNMEHVVVRSDRTPMANLRRTASIYGLPVLNICNEGWFDAINDDAAARGIRVMLEATMGNATISESGVLALPELFRQGRLLSWLKLVFRLVRNRSMRPTSILWNSFSPFIPDRLFCWMLERKHGPRVDPSRYSGLKHEHWRAAVLEGAGPASRGRKDNPSAIWLRASDTSRDHRLALLSGDDTGASWKGILGEWKIDYRDPTTDRRLVEFSLRMPVQQLIQNGEPRALLRKMLADRVPREIIDNRHKGYQAADWHEWLDDSRQEVSAEVARIEMFDPSAEILDVERLKALVDNWPESGSEEWSGPAAIADYRCCLLRSISAASFMRQAAGSNY